LNQKHEVDLMVGVTCFSLEFVARRLSLDVAVFVPPLIAIEYEPGVKVFLGGVGGTCQKEDPGPTCDHAKVPSWHLALGGRVEICSTPLCCRVIGTVVLLSG